MQAVSEYILRKTKLYRYVDHAGCIRVYLDHVQDEIRILHGYIESDKTTSIYNVSTRVLSKK